MTRQEVYREIQDTLGLVPTMFKALPDEALACEWGAFKSVRVDEDVIPAKYRELIGLATGAALGDRFAAMSHRELAKTYGASGAEVEAAIRLAKDVAGWSVYVTGLGLDMQTVREEIGLVCERLSRGCAVEGPMPTGLPH